MSILAIAGKQFLLETIRAKDFGSFHLSVFLINNCGYIGYTDIN